MEPIEPGSWQLAFGTARKRKNGAACGSRSVTTVKHSVGDAPLGREREPDTEIQSGVALSLLVSDGRVRDAHPSGEVDGRPEFLPTRPNRLSSAASPSKRCRCDQSARRA